MSSGILGISTGLLTPECLLSSPKRRLSGGRGPSGWRGGCASRYGEAGVGVGEDKGFVEPTGHWRKLAFSGSGGRAVWVAVAQELHGQPGTQRRRQCKPSKRSTTGRCSWKLNPNHNPVRVDACFVGTNSFQDMVLSWIWV